MKRAADIFKQPAGGRPFTGAWIETMPSPGDFDAAQVAPSRGRGLKREGVPRLEGHVTSPLHGGVD